MNLAPLFKMQYLLKRKERKEDSQREKERERREREASSLSLSRISFFRGKSLFLVFGFSWFFLVFLGQFEMFTCTRSCDYE